MSSNWGPLDDKEENDLNKARLFNVEAKPFSRVTKHLATLHSHATSKARQAPTPPPEGSAANGDDHPGPDLTQLRDDIKLDFAAFHSNLGRLQFLINANEQQREDYAAKRGRILAESQAVRDKTGRLRGQLDEARATLEQRKQFDVLADRITSNKALRTRTEQAANLKKLQDEIAELEAESDAYAVTWRERREQFSRIMDESMRLRRLIRDEKEEVERREGMDDGEVEGSQTPRPGVTSGNVTPRPESGLHPRSALENGEGADTPAAASTGGVQTPAAESTAADGHLLKPRPDHSLLGSRSASQAPLSREPTPSKPDIPETPDDASQRPDEDVKMAEAKESGEEDDDSPMSTPLSEPALSPAADMEAGDDVMDTT